MFAVSQIMHCECMNKAHGLAARRVLDPACKHMLLPGTHDGDMIGHVLPDKLSWFYQLETFDSKVPCNNLNTLHRLPEFKGVGECLGFITAGAIDVVSRSFVAKGAFDPLILESAFLPATIRQGAY
jgi:hypothetical protein